MYPNANTLTQPLTKIVATLGPATSDPEVIAAMIRSGVRVARLNFSHGTFEEFSKFLAAARAAEKIVGIPLAVMGDLCGPKVRVGDVPEGPIQLNVNDRFIVSNDDCAAHRNAQGLLVLGTNQAAVVADAQVGHRLYIADGAIKSVVEEKHNGCLTCRITAAGKVSRRKGINLPDTGLSIPTMTDWDRECTAWAVKNDLDWLALSFVRSGKDIDDLKFLINKLDGSDASKEKVNRIRTVAKVEVPQALTALGSICAAADAIMVARGDLGVEMDLEQVPVLQKRIMAAAHAHGKSVIVATQMLESMITAASPTRAEVSDVANAVLDGADAVMLSAETSVGQFPVETIGYMARTAIAAEDFAATLGLVRPQTPEQLTTTTRYRTAALAMGVQAAATSIKAKRIVVWTEFGGGARYLSQLRLAVPITAFSCNRQALRQVGMLYGVRPVMIDRPENANEFLHTMDRYLMDKGYLTKGDPVIVVLGTPFGVAGAGSTNTLQIHYAGDADAPAAPAI